LAEPEIYFRIIHVGPDRRNGISEYREHTVEIAPGPKGAFENSNIGTLTRRVPADRVVSAVPRRHPGRHGRPRRRPQQSPLCNPISLTPAVSGRSEHCEPQAA